MQDKILKNYFFFYNGIKRCADGQNEKKINFILFWIDSKPDSLRVHM